MWSPNFSTIAQKSSTKINILIDATKKLCLKAQTCTGPGKLLMFGVWEIGRNWPQMHKFLGLKDTNPDIECHVMSKNGNFIFQKFFVMRRSLEHV